MKIRAGFVSNSSSSSFVAIGWRMNAKDACKLLGIDETGDYLDDLYNHRYVTMADEGDVIVGKHIALISEDDWNSVEVDLADAVSEVQEIAERFSMTENPRIITGMKYS